MDYAGKGPPEQAATDVATIRVLEECKYHFDLQAEMNVAMAKGGAYESLRYVLHSEGDLIARDAAQPLNLESRNAAVDLEMTITGFKVEDCTIVRTDPGFGFGHLDATAEVRPESLGIRLGPIQGFTWRNEAVGTCADESRTVTRSGSIPSSTDHLTTFHFVLDGGSVPVKVSLFEEGQRNFRNHGGYAKYTATLTVKRAEGE
jgi:hypothetical protein